MGKPDWSTFVTVYEELTKRGVSHDAAADKALYLANRGMLPEKRNWGLIARHCQINEAQSGHNRRCTSLGEVLDIAAGGNNPEQITIAREALGQVPGDILDLFADRQRPLTSTECARIHRFRKRFGNDGRV